MKITLKIPTEYPLFVDIRKHETIFNLFSTVTHFKNRNFLVPLADDIIWKTASYPVFEKDNGILLNFL